MIKQILNWFGYVPKNDTYFEQRRLERDIESWRKEMHRQEDIAIILRKALKESDDYLQQLDTIFFTAWQDQRFCGDINEESRVASEEIVKIIKEHKEIK